MLLALWSGFLDEAYWATSPPVSGGGLTQGIPVGWGSGRRHGVAGQRSDDIQVERRKPSGFNKLRIQEIDNHDIMLFAKTFRQFRK